MLNNCQEDTLKNMINQYLCPGCINGNGINDTCFQKNNDYGYTCQKHFVGTIYNGQKIILGMPKGFNKVGNIGTVTNVKFFEQMNDDFFDFFNIPVWAMEYENNLFVRVFQPRQGVHYIFVIKNGKLKDINIKSSGNDIGELEQQQFNVIDVSKFKDLID